MRQLIFPFAIKSFEEIVCLADINRREFLETIRSYDREYNILRSNRGSSTSKEYNSPEANKIGEGIHYLLNSCNFGDLIESRLFSELEKKYRPFEW